MSEQTDTTPPGRRGPATKAHGEGAPGWARRLRAAREREGLSALALAKATGISPRTMYDHDAGRYPPDAVEAVLIARQLRTTVEALFGPEQPGTEQTL